VCTPRSSLWSAGTHLLSFRGRENYVLQVITIHTLKTELTTLLVHMPITAVCNCTMWLQKGPPKVHETKATVTAVCNCIVWLQKGPPKVHETKATVTAVCNCTAWLQKGPPKVHETKATALSQLTVFILSKSSDKDSCGRAVQCDSLILFEWKETVHTLDQRY
jgi:ABC-type polysaccharide/polyol phosphate transport system ATPase subunit